MPQRWTEAEVVDLGPPINFEPAKPQEGRRIPEALAGALASGAWLWWQVFKVTSKRKLTERFWGLHGTFMVLCSGDGAVHSVARLKDLETVYVQHLSPGETQLLLSLRPDAREPSIVIRIPLTPSGYVRCGGRPDHAEDPLEPLRVINFLLRSHSRPSPPCLLLRPDIKVH
eukprot:Hpha_TRINITY_DN32398_c0_g1::TRINITY_DN32398_c0_g1_i1::g.145659::m.145659